MEDHAVVPERVFDAACGGGVAEVEEWLTSAAASRDVDQGNGITALLSCATFSTPFDANSVRIVRLLISHGADVNHIATDGSSPLINVLHLCHGNRCSEIAVLSMVSILIRAGADVLKSGPHGLPFSMAMRRFTDVPSAFPCDAKSGVRRRRRMFMEIVTMLLRAGAASTHNYAVVTMMQNLTPDSGYFKPEMARDPHFATVKRHVQGLRAHGSWSAYVLAQRLEVLTLRGLANRRRSNGTVTSRGMIRSADPALNNLVALPNELICQVLAFWFG